MLWHAFNTDAHTHHTHQKHRSRDRSVSFTFLPTAQLNRKENPYCRLLRRIKMERGDGARGDEENE